MVLVTYPAPDFTAPAILSNGNMINNFNFKEFTNNTTTVLFFWPMDFTFVCPSEILAFNKELPEFEKRKTKVIGVSIDSIYVHHAWKNHLSKLIGKFGEIQFTMISDIKRDIQRSYGIEHPQLGVALRGSFLIDKNRIVRHQIINDLPFGRNIPDILRMIDALHFHEKNGEVCPANWKKGESGIKTTPDGIQDYLNKNFKNQY